MSFILEEGVPSNCVEDGMVEGWGRTELWEVVATVETTRSYSLDTYRKLVWVGAGVQHLRSRGRRQGA